MGHQNHTWLYVSTRVIWKLQKFYRHQTDKFKDIDLCLVHVIWKERRMSKLVLNVKYLLLLSFFTSAKFYDLGHILAKIGVH